MWIWKKLQNKKGFTLIELIVTFVLIGIFMVSATAVMSSFMHVFARVKSISSAQNVADVLLTKAAGELSGGQGGGFSPEKMRRRYPQKNILCISIRVRRLAAAGMTLPCFGMRRAFR